MSIIDPEYEIWGLDNTRSDMDCGSGHHREDCFSLDEAKKACREWQSDGRAAWIVDKETGCHVSC
jgi:hypothetical protein